MKTKKQVFSKPFNLVYENNYPDLLVGPGFFTEQNIASSSDPKTWVKQKPEEIERERAKQVFTFKSFRKTDATKFDKNLSEIQLLSQAEKTTEIEVDLEEKKSKLVKENYSGINNFSYNLEDLKIIDNIKIPQSIDKVVNDTDLKAKDGILTLNEKLDDVYKIEQILSMGLLGVSKNRVLVPTRWAITSTDDIISKDLIENSLLDYGTIDKYEVFSFMFYQNIFYVLFIPRIWGFEQIEIQGDNVCEDFEINGPRKKYASSVTGGYYASRIEVAKYLAKRKRQASVIVFRDISPSYHSKGVWVIRETVKEALTKEPYLFDSLEEATGFINQHIRNGASYWLQHSQLYKEIKTQKKITDFFK
jgi:DNA repair protein NreA